MYILLMEIFIYIKPMDENKIVLKYPNTYWKTLNC